MDGELILRYQDAGSNLSWQGIKRKAVYTVGAGPVCKHTGQCTLEGSVQGGGWRPGGAKFFKLVFKIDQSETIKSHMFSMSFRLTNNK